MELTDLQRRILAFLSTQTSPVSLADIASGLEEDISALIDLEVIPALLDADLVHAEWQSDGVPRHYRYSITDAGREHQDTD